MIHMSENIGEMYERIINKRIEVPGLLQLKVPVSDNFSDSSGSERALVAPDGGLVKIVKAFAPMYRFTGAYTTTWKDLINKINEEVRCLHDFIYKDANAFYIGDLGLDFELRGHIFGNRTSIHPADAEYAQQKMMTKDMFRKGYGYVLSFYVVENDHAPQ